METKPGPKIARWLRRLANRLDPQPQFKVFEPYTTATSGTTITDFKIVQSR